MPDALVMTEPAGSDGREDMYFAYDRQATAYLADRDKRLGAAIAQIGHIDRPVDSDLFSSIVHHIIGQQISTAAQATVWKRLTEYDAV